MCDKCFEIDKQIDHYRLLASRLSDQLMLDGIKQLIDRTQAEKAALHPEQNEVRSPQLAASSSGEQHMDSAKCSFDDR
jgi:hypothetical protein